MRSLWRIRRELVHVQDARAMAALAQQRVRPRDAAAVDVHTAARDRGQEDELHADDDLNKDDRVDHLTGVVLIARAVPLGG